MIGRVVSVKMQNTVVVQIDTHKVHPKYKKSYLRNKKYLVDDRIGANLGDIVEFLECRPISKRKHWRVNKILGKDEVVLGEELMKQVAEEAIEEVLPEEEETVEESKEELEVKSRESGEKVEEQKVPKEKEVKKSRGKKMEGVK